MTKITCSFFEQNHSYRVHIGYTPHVWPIIKAEYATLVGGLAARHPANVHLRPPHLLSTLRLVDLGAPDIKRFWTFDTVLVMLALPEYAPAAVLAQVPQARWDYAKTLRPGESLAPSNSVPSRLLFYHDKNYL